LETSAWFHQSALAVALASEQKTPRSLIEALEREAGVEV
jgi:hypothetical protein